MEKIYEIVSLVKSDCPEIARFFMGGMHKYCVELGISQIQGGALLHLLESEKYLSQTDICDYLDMNAPVVSRLIDDLENAGLVKRDIDNDNRRKHILILTDIGKEKALALDRATTEIYATILRDLDKQECETIKGIFAKIKGSIK
jgi:DNA-binding MarR family transcriptional regulator